jgi:beta propeller repeat protein
MRGRVCARVVFGLLAGGAMLIPLLESVPRAGAQEGVGIERFTVVERRREQVRPRIDGNWVVWQDYREVEDRNGEELNADIIARNLRTGDEWVLNDDRTASQPDVWGDWMVYAEEGVGGADIRGYDRRRDEWVWVVRAAGSDQERPAIDNGLVVWQDNRDGRWGIRATSLYRDEEFWVHNRHDSDQTGPRISGQIVVWEDDRDGCCDVFAKNLDSGDV